MSGALHRCCALLAAVLLLLAHAVLPGLHRYQHACEDHGARPVPCCACGCPAGHDQQRGDTCLPKNRHSHEHDDGCALCTLLLAQGDLLPCGGGVVVVRMPVPHGKAWHAESLLLVGRRGLPPPVRGPPAA